MVEKGIMYRGRVQSAGVSTVLIVLCLLAGCANETSVVSDKQNGLRKSISQLHGVYMWRADASQYDYSKKAELEEILATVPLKQAVEVLIECIDDTSPSASVLDGRPVYVGVVCYQGLWQSVYYEPTDQRGDVALDWAGYISPKSSPESMRSAKEAWRKAQQENKLVFQ